MTDWLRLEVWLYSQRGDGALTSLTHGDSLTSDWLDVQSLFIHHHV